MQAKRIRVRGVEYVRVESLFAKRPLDVWQKLQDAIMSAERGQTPEAMQAVKKGFMELHKLAASLTNDRDKQKALRAKEASDFLGKFISKVFPLEGGMTKMPLKDLQQQGATVFSYLEGVSSNDLDRPVGTIRPLELPKGQYAEAATMFHKIMEQHTAAEASPDQAAKIVETNKRLIAIGDSMLRKITEEWNKLNSIGGPQRHDPSAMLTQLLPIITPESSQLFNDQMKFWYDRNQDIIKNSKQISDTNKVLAPKRLQNVSEAPQNVMKEWQREGAFIPPAQLRVKGTCYRYVGPAPTANARYAEGAVPEAYKEKVFNTNKVQNTIIETLQNALRDAWYKLRSSIVAKLPQGEPPADILLNLFGPEETKEFGKIATAYKDAFFAAREAYPHIVELRKELEKTNEPVPLTKVKQQGEKVEISMDALDDGSKRLVHLWLNNHKGLKPGTPQYKALEQKYIRRVIDMNKQESQKDLGSKARMYASVPPSEIVVRGVRYKLAARDVTLEDLSPDERKLVEHFMSKHPEAKPGTQEHQNLLLKYIQRVLSWPTDVNPRHVVFLPQ